MVSSCDTGQRRSGTGFVLMWHPGVRRAIHQFPMLFVAASAMVGLIMGPWLPTEGWSVQWLSGSVIVLIGFWLAFRTGHRSNWIVATMIGLPLYASGYVSTVSSYESASIRTVVSEQSQPAIVRATIDRAIVLRRHPLADSPRRRGKDPWQTQFECRVTEARLGTSFHKMTGRLLAVVDGKMSDRRPGDELEIYGSMRSFATPSNPGERDLRDVYQRRGLHGRIDVDSKEQLVLRKRSSKLSSAVASFAGTSRELLLQHTTKSTGPLAIALVIGQRDFVDPDTRDLLLVTGTAHLLSVSGMHLAIMVVLAKIIAFVCRMTPTIESIWVLGVCASYVAITGGRPPVLRAAVLVIALLFAMRLRRPSQPLNTLAFAALLLLYCNPLNATAVGMQLSFLAVATLLLCGQRSRSGSTAVEQAKQHEERLQRLSDGSRFAIVRWFRFTTSYLRQLSWFSACVTATSMPLVWYHFHVVSPISVLTNVALSPFLIFALGFGVCTVFGGLLSSALGSVFGIACSGVLSIMHWIIRFSASLPFSHVWLPSPPATWIAVFYIVLAASLLLSDRYKWYRRSWIFLWGVVAWIMAVWPSPLDDGAIEATFVDVGHGTSAILRLNRDEVWLYDCGRLANDIGSSRDIDAALWSMGVTHLRGIILSHADSDHYNALPGLLKRFRVDQIITPPGMLSQDEAGALDATRQAIAVAGVPVREFAAGQTIATDNLTLEVLHPPASGVGGNDNANSLVLNIPVGRRVLLLPGDLEPPGTNVLLNQPRPHAGGVLMAPHHGSLAMSAEAVLQWARPSETIVSGGQRARRPEVSKMLAITGSGVHVTANIGAVRVTIRTKGEIEIRSWKQSPW